MKKHLLLLLMLICFGSITTIVKAHTVKPDSVNNTQIIKRGKLTLTLVNTDSTFSLVTKKRLIDAFFTVYPAEMKEYNTRSLTEVTFIIDTSYQGVAATYRGVVHFNPKWFVKHPEDIDVVTHEVMHIVQNYGGNKVPGWLTEGIADYARYKFGINNAASGWSLTPYKAGQSYTNAYRITARFLVWVEQNKNKTIVKTLDKHMREGTYTPELWAKLTGSTVDELWAQYILNPDITQG